VPFCDIAVRVDADPQRLGEALITVDDRLRRRLAPLNLILHPAEALQLGA